MDKDLPSADEVRGILKRAQPEPITVRWTRRDGVTVETTTDLHVRVDAAVREWEDPDAGYGDTRDRMYAVLEAALMATEGGQP